MIGVCYYPEHWPEDMWEQDAQEMQDLGITYVRLAEFSWSKLEPEPGNYHFNWLDKVIEILGKKGMKVILCTPTATPPKWLIDLHPDILPVDIHTGQTRGFGSRRHYDFSSQAYFEASMKITQVMAERYGKHPNVVGWQTDNEIACHDTTHSGSLNAKLAFQTWCKSQYKTIESLNSHWGTIFWSMEYQNFEQIELPILAVTEAHPSHLLAYRRFSSDQVIHYHNAMVAVIRKHCPAQFITHNFIPIVDTQCDDFALSKPLDFVSYDNYPLGRADLFFANTSTADFSQYMRTGHPDFSSCSFDQIRGLSDAPFWIMEQQPGPVNWGGHNPRPEPGMVRLWSWEAIAHGASTICYFRWRQAAFAQEQMHAGIKRVDNSKSPAWYEAAQFLEELSSTGFELDVPVDASVAIIMDKHNQWVTEIERQGDSFNQQSVEFEYYTALRQLGLNVDFVSQETNLEKYKLVIAPCVPIIKDSLIDNLQHSNAHLIAGPRTGSKTDELTLVPNLAPGKLQALIGIKVLSVETLRLDCKIPLNYSGKTYLADRWNEELSVNDDVEVIGKFENKQAVIAQNTKATYIGALCNGELLKTLLSDIAIKQGLTPINVPNDVRLSYRGKFGVYVNYGSTSSKVSIPEDAKLVLGNEIMPAHSVTVFAVK